MRLNEDTVLRLTGSDAVLVPYSKSHVETYHKWMGDEELLRLTCSERLTLDEEYENQRSWRIDEKKLTFIILDARRDCVMAGDVNLYLNGDNHDGAAEIEVMIAATESRRHGLARAALSLMMAYACEKLSVMSFIAKVLLDNAPSLALFDRLGFHVVRTVPAFGESHLTLSVDEGVGEQLNNRPVQTVPDPQAKCYLDPDFVGGVAKLPGKHTSSNTKTTNVASSSSSSSASSSASGHSSSGHSSSADHSSSGHSSSGDKTTSATATDGNPSTPTDKSQTTTETASGDQQGLVTPATASDPSSSCFPSDALVTVEGSGEVPISTVQIGDRVLVGAGTFSPVFAFSHRDPSVMTEHAEFTLSSGRKLTLTPGHHLEANGKLVAAGEVRVGDVLIAANGASDSVSQIKSVRATGLYNPHTLSGSIAVNGVVCSTYTTAVASSAAQALLAPLRALFLTGAVTERTAGQFLARGASSRLF